MPKLYLFPTGNAFHGSCLCAEVMELAPPAQQRQIRRLMERLAGVPEGATAVPAEGGGGGEGATTVEALRRALEGEVAVEDPHAGEIVARMVVKPFVLPEERGLVASWEL
jgi:hypothetical protein